jgi:hypothetical protein
VAANCEELEEIMKSRFTTVEFPVFSDFTIHIEVASDFEKAVKKYPSIADVAGPEDHLADALTIYDGGHVCFIFLKSNTSAGTVAHEAWHAIRHMMQRMGVELDNEGVAYHLSYLVDEIFKFLKRRK